MGVRRPEPIMTSSESTAVLNPERRTAIFYTTVFMSGGATATALPLWLNSVGISSEQIGIINAAPIFAMLLINMLVGRLADRASDWRQMIVYSSFVCAIVSIALFFVSDFWGIVVVWTLATLPNAGVIPVIDAAALRLTKRRGTDFGALRAWGTVGYMTLNAAAGFVVAGFGAGAFVPLFVGLTAVRAFAALILPRFREPAREVVAGGIKDVSRLRAVMKPWFVLPLVGFSIVYSSHAVFNAFCALIWQRQGVPGEIIGPLVALAGVGETILMFAWRRFSHRFSARKVILFASLAACIRWIMNAFVPPVPVLITLQLAHSVTYAVGFLGCIQFIGNWTDESIAAETQGFFVALQQAMAVVALLAFGWLMAGMGEHAFFVLAAYTLVGGFCVWLSLRLQQPKAAA